MEHMQLSSKQIKAFQTHILDWYATNKRDLPWRVPGDTLVAQRDPYTILVSEVMAQQTQLSRVIPKYKAWIQRFPTLESLAHASTQEVLRLWSGLGYNRRAIYLQKCAKELCNEIWNKPIWPQTEKDLVKLPGIGKYTARAILCFAFNQQLAVVDTNVRKVILTQLIHPTKRSMSAARITEKEIEDISEQLLPQGHAYEWNQALMDYAAMVLKNEKHPQVQKQSPFKGSDRYYRGKIIRLLINKERISVNKARQVLHEGKNTLTQERFDKIIKGLIKDNVVQITKDTISLISL